MDDMKNLILCDGPLDVNSINSKWFNELNFLIMCIITFNGVVRDENGIDGLSFDIYELS